MAIKKSELYSSLWASCDELRGGMDASQYKDYVLVLLFVKYVSDKYAGQKDALLVVPKGGGFADMVAVKGDKENGDKMNKIVDKLAEANDLVGLFKESDFNDDAKLGKGQDMVDRLSKLVGIFQNLDFSRNRVEGDDLLGDAYEYLMRNFATESGKSKGQFYTPAEVCRIMAKVVGVGNAKNTSQTIYDPTRGSGSLLLKAHDEARTVAGLDLAVYGQEMDNATTALAKMNMILHDCPAAAHDIWQDNVLSSPHFKERDGRLKTFDYAVANPPFSFKSWTTGFNLAADEFKRFEFGIPPTKNGDFAFLLHILTSLKSAGKAAINLPHGVLFRGGAEADIRKNIVRRGYIKGIIGLPANLFYGTGIPACIIVLDKENAAARKGIFMIDASKGFIKDGNKNRLRDQDIHKIVDTFTRQLEIKRYSRMVSLAEISDGKNDFNLNLPRYIDSSEPEDLQDIDGHLNGGIPVRDVDALENYWQVIPAVRRHLFNSFPSPRSRGEGQGEGQRAGYVQLSVPIAELKQTIFGHAEFTAYNVSATKLFAKWKAANTPLLKGITKGGKPKALIETLSEDLLDTFEKARLLDPYDIYQHLMDYWAETMQDDVYMIVSDGWREAAKYLEELHANEVAILPYYVANLNIEATYAAIAGEYLEYPNLCFVDTLDNTYALRKYRGHMDDLFGALSDDNVRRIRRQNSRKISVIIGNPPYNANQLNENENNKNREYPEIDKRIKETYIEESTAQKTKLYDMYARFFRWASDRLDENGVLAFITNRSFIESRTFDGFRKVIDDEFNEVYVLDLGGDVRINPKLSGTKHNVFGIQTGVAISFMVKRAKAKGCRIFYARRPEFETAEEKLAFLNTGKLDSIPVEEIRPDVKNNWINLSQNDFEKLMPLATKEVKAAKNHSRETAIFKLFSLGVVTARDEWVYDFDKAHVKKKVGYLIDRYNADLLKVSRIRHSKKLAELLDKEIKWTRAVKNDLRKGVKYHFDNDSLMEVLYRPFVRRALYFNKRLNEMQYRLGSLFTGEPNPTIAFLCVFSSNPLAAMAVTQPFDYCLLKMGNGGTQAVSFWAYVNEGKRRENITDWALDQFRDQYQSSQAERKRLITKDTIFHYIYGVLNDPIYREKYALNLEREFPRIPFYKDFWQLAQWGKELMDLHIGYETVTPAKLKRIDVPDEKARKAGLPPKCVLKADKEAGWIIVDSKTTLTGIPSEAWDYRLGNRSALEWILDQYKEKKPKDPTIREKFNTYHFADYKEKVIDLLMRVTTVSVRTVAITKSMKNVVR